MSLTTTQEATLENGLEQKGLIDFTNDFVQGHDPRRLAKQLEPKFDLKLRPQQKTILEWMERQAEKKSVNSLYKTRDEGASTLLAIFLVYNWLYTEGFTGIVHGRKPNMVDLSSMSREETNSLFGKITFIIQHLPDEVMPKEYKHGHAWLKNDAMVSCLFGLHGSFEYVEDYFKVNREPVDVMFWDELMFTAKHGQIPYLAPVKSHFKILPVAPPYPLKGTPNQHRYLHWMHNPERNTYREGKLRGTYHHPWYTHQARHLRSPEIELEYAPSYVESVQHVVEFEDRHAVTNRSINPDCFNNGTNTNVKVAVVKNTNFKKD